jgi:hypothetical protein
MAQKRLHSWIKEYKADGSRKHYGRGAYAVRKYWEADDPVFPEGVYNFAVSKSPKRKAWYWMFDSLDKAKRFAKDNLI